MAPGKVGRKTGENTAHMKRQCANLVEVTVPFEKSYSSPYFQSCPCGKSVLLVNSEAVLRSTSPSRGSLVEKEKALDPTSGTP